MEPIELKLKEALTRSHPVPAAELAGLNDRIIQTFARKQKSVYCLTAAYLAFMAILIIVLLALYMCTTDLKQCLIYGIAILVLFEGTVLMKLWFWVMHGKIATVREIKLLQLAVLELKTNPSPKPPGTGPAFTDAGEEPASTETSARKSWQAVLVPVWLLAVAGLVYSSWPQNPPEPRDVTPYFEKAGTATDGTGETQWQQSFEVTRSRERFYPQVVTRGPAARVWISVGEENGAPMFSGFVETGSRIGFGQAAPGRYLVKGRTERADGGFTLRIGGVDEVPGVLSQGRMFAHFFLLMLSAMVIIVIPLLWLQRRWLRQLS
jgi:hypothetical protein